ncbi:MAG: hypothetical protein JOZ16_04485 [Methylobacteriaceae bacterium]|nr:hypothetical protein [Methylobacteriaceae bacterium]
MTLASFLRGRGDRANPLRTLGRDMLRRADQARDRGAHAEAAILYREGLRLLPHRADIHVQCGNMLKESGDFGGAEIHYTAAARGLPEDADLALQFGHLYKSAGRLDDAVDAYERALRLKPGWDAPVQELAKLKGAGWIGGLAADAAAQPILRKEASASRLPIGLGARPLTELLRNHAEEIEFRRLGRKERTYWGVLPVLRGVEAIRGFCISEEPILSIELYLNDELIYRAPPAASFPLVLERENPRLRKYVFNIWIDVSGFVRERHELECRARRARGGSISRREQLCIDAVPERSLLPESDARLKGRDRRIPLSLDAQINARPSQIRPAGQPLLREGPRCILVQRADQLGDLVVSVPALRRLRSMFPEARLVGLVSRANAELAGSLGLFDAVLTIDFPLVLPESRRVLSTEGFTSLQAQLKGFVFDLAIDLSEAESSRLLLPLSNAPVLVGYRSGQLPGLDIDISANTYDKANDHEIVPHAKKALGLIQWLEVVLSNEPNIARRDDLDQARLADFGLVPGTRFVVLHAGARARFSRWPHYLELAHILVEKTDLHVVMMAVAGEEPPIPDALARSGRFQMISRLLDFDDFDALLTFCAIFVGDDSGPKHLASLRGAKVVSVQTARNNWMEWGQMTAGSIITRSVPCAGCLIQNDTDAQECGRDIVCLTGIAPHEVFTAIERQLAQGS